VKLLHPSFDGEDSLMEGVTWQSELKLSANYGASEEDGHVMLMVPMEDGPYVPVIDGRVDGSDGRWSCHVCV
jgi:hypothetical protein